MATNIPELIEEINRNYNLLKEFEISTNVKIAHKKQVERDLTEGLLLIYNHHEHLLKSVKEYQELEEIDLVEEVQRRLEIISPYIDLLIILWEPKVTTFLQTDFVQRAIKTLNTDVESIAQELRYSIIKAAKLFNPNTPYTTKKGEEKKVLFHTYLHLAMRNTVFTLITKDKKRKQYAKNKYVNEITLDQLIPLHDPANSEFKRTEPEDIRSVNSFDEIETRQFIEDKNLEDIEKRFLFLRQDGMTMEEITEDLKACKKCSDCKELNYAHCVDKNGESAYKVRQILRTKFSDLIENY